MTTEKLIFATTFEGLLRSLQGRLTPALEAGLKERGLDVSRPLLPAYPLPVFTEVLRYLSAELFPDLPLDAAVAQLGRDFMNGFEETMLGRAMLAVIRLIGPRRTLERVSRQFRNGNNFTETRLTPLGAQAYELWVNEVRMPGWYVGLVGRGLELAGGKEVKVELKAHDTSATYLVTWR